MKTTLQLIGQLREVATFLKRSGDTLEVKIMFDAAARLEAAASLADACEAFYHAECEKFNLHPFNSDSNPESPVQQAWCMARTALAAWRGA